MLNTLEYNILVCYILKQMNLSKCLLLRQSCKYIYNITDINDKDNNEYIWKYFYINNMNTNYCITDKSVHISNYNCVWKSWDIIVKNLIYNKFMNSDKFNNFITKDNNKFIKNIEEIEQLHDTNYFKSVFNDDCLKYKEIIVNTLLYFDFDLSLYTYYNSFTRQFKNLKNTYPTVNFCVCKEHYRIDTLCTFKKKVVNYKSYFKELSKRFLTKYKKQMKTFEIDKIKFIHKMNCLNREIKHKQQELDLYKSKIIENNNLNENYKNVKLFLNK